MDTLMQTYRRRWLGLALVLGACGGGGEDANNGWTCVGGCGAEGVTAIDDAVKAERFTGSLAAVAERIVPVGSYTDRIVDGLSGSARISGRSVTRTGSCGTDCLSRRQDTDVTIVFNEFRAKSGGNTEVTVSGTGRLVDTRASRQVRDNFFSSGGIRFSSPSLTAAVLTTDSNGRTYGVSDSAGLSATASAGSRWSGSLRTSNGVSYSF